MVFNLHDQFETLRAQGKYEGMREKIMVRDEALAGSRNPMLRATARRARRGNIAAAWSTTAGAARSTIRGAG